jgi:hypothetical protein
MSMKATVAGLIQAAGESLTYRRLTLRETDAGEVLVDSTTDVVCYGAPTPFVIVDADYRTIETNDISVEVDAQSFDSAGLVPKSDDFLYVNGAWRKILDYHPRRWQGETVAYSMHIQGIS